MDKAYNNTTAKKKQIVHLTCGACNRNFTDRVESSKWGTLTGKECPVCKDSLNVEINWNRTNAASVR